MIDLEYVFLTFLARNMYFFYKMTILRWLLHTGDSFLCKLINFDCKLAFVEWDASLFKRNLGWSMKFRQIISRDWMSHHRLHTFRLVFGPELYITQWSCVHINVYLLSADSFKIMIIRSLYDVQKLVAHYNMCWKYPNSHCLLVHKAD